MIAAAQIAEPCILGWSLALAIGVGLVGALPLLLLFLAIWKFS